jgi:hypothetical protein
MAKRAWVEWTDAEKNLIQETYTLLRGQGMKVAEVFEYTSLLLVEQGFTPRTPKSVEVCYYAVKNQRKRAEQAEQADTQVVTEVIAEPVAPVVKPTVSPQEQPTVSIINTGESILNALEQLKEVFSALKVENEKLAAENAAWSQKFDALNTEHEEMAHNHGFLLRIIEEARKSTLELNTMGKAAFKMDRNGNLERVI